MQQQQRFRLRNGRENITACIIILFEHAIIINLFTHTHIKTKNIQKKTETRVNNINRIRI